MKRSGFEALYRLIRKYNRSDIKAVSEAIGTVLLLGISVTLAGGVALWTSQIDEGEEGLYIDLWADVSGSDLVLTHKGGDLLSGASTTIRIYDQDGSLSFESTYADHTADDRWDPGEEMRIDLDDPFGDGSVSISNVFDVKVITPTPGGIMSVILSNTLYRTTMSTGLPDLAITQVVIQNQDHKPITRMNDTGTYLISVRVDNFGSDMTAEFFSKEAGNKVKNLRIFDSVEALSFTALEMVHHVDSTGDDLEEGDAGFGIMSNSDYFTATFTWSRTSVNPRALGTHTLNVKVVPFPEGEINYRNNYVERSYKVDKLVVPVPIFGPDPGIYDIYFSNDAPSSGEEVTVTVIVQNSGDKPITMDHHVNMIVSTWSPEIHSGVSSVSYDWRVDYDGHYGEWRSNSWEGVDLVDDDTFPTCVKTDIILLPGAYFFYYFTLEARVDVPGGEQWVYAAIDVYDNPGQVEGISVLEGDMTSDLDNMELGHIQVLPRIMVVDDDEANTGYEGDMTSFVLEALVGSGVSVDKVFVTQEIEDNNKLRDAPAYNYEQEEIAAPAMEDYDIVIWVTGSVVDPLTNKPRATEDEPGGNIQELMDYMDSERYVMIVGSSPYEGLDSNFNSGNTLLYSGDTTVEKFSDASRFLYTYMGISHIDIDVDLPHEEPIHLTGIDTEPGGLTPISESKDAYHLILLGQEPDNDLCQLYTPRDILIEGSDGLDFEIAQGILTQDSELDPVTDKVNVIRSWSSPLGEFGSQYRSVSMGFDINQIKYLNEKINLFASVLRWFDWEINVGRDLAVTKMELSIITQTGENTWENFPVGPDNIPKYLDTIELEVTVRNNGPISESTSVMFYATGPDNIELPITTGIPDPRTKTEETNTNPQDISGLMSGGGEEVIYKLWLAVGVGIYTFRVVVDPYHLITEISEENNDISYSTSTITSFVTQNNILVVDDDMSEDNFAQDVDTLAQMEDLLEVYPMAEGEPSEVINNALDLFEYDHETHTVVNSYDLGSASWKLDSGLGILDLKRYNSIIWILGDSGADLIGELETITVKDIQAIKKYLDGDYPEAGYLPPDHNENVMFIGQNMILDLLDCKDTTVLPGTPALTVGDFMEQYIGLDQTGTSQGGSGQMIKGPTTGEFVEDIYVGIEYDVSDFDTTFSYNTLPVPTTLIGPNERTRVGLYNDDGEGTLDLIATQFEKADEGGSMYFRTLTHSWQFCSAAHSTLESSYFEMLFLSLHWFGTPEPKPELLSRNSKISFDNDNPVLGNSYLVTVEIANLGGTAGGGTVRFTDGNTLIKSESIFINPDQTTTLEAIWTPLYAGTRQMTIWIDRYNNYDEVFDNFNNMPYQTREIYFFWDDMESGDGNWNHDTTNVMINGEGKLDYMGEPTNVNIDPSWGGNYGFSVNTATGNANLISEYHSSPRSYVMHEPSGTSQKASDIVFDIDSSGSMGIDYDNNDPDNIRKSAARNFIDNMYDEDRVAVYDFDSTVTLRQKLTFDKTAAKSAIGWIDSSGSTALYRSGAEALDYLGKYGRSESEAVKALIILTDGQDTASSPIGLSDYLDTKELYDNDPSTEEMIYVFTIRFVDGDANILQQMCTQPWGDGPYYFEANDPDDLNDIYATIGEIIEDISQSSTRSTEDLPTRATIWSEDFPTNSLDLTRWTTGGSSNLVSSDPQSGSYCMELDYSDAPETLEIDLSGQRSAYLDFYWRGGYYGGAQGALESGDELFLDIHTSAGWFNNFYVVNNNCYYTPWTHENIVLPQDALWNEFKVRFRSSVGYSAYYDAYYIDNINVETGTIGKGSLGGEYSNYWSDGTIASENKFTETNAIDLTHVNNADLSFYHKYNLERGSNGGVILIGTSDTIDGTYQYRYIQPDQPYTGNILITEWHNNKDDFENEIKWCWNGISAGGTLDWSHVTVNLEDFVIGGAFEANFIKIRFQYLYAYGGTGYGWIIDDVMVTTSSDSDNSNKYDTMDHWKLKKVEPGYEGVFSHSGDYSWFCGDDSKVGDDKGDLLSGVDNSLYTRPIDLTNAKTAWLSAYFKFNFDNDAGRPPDGFRVEVSSDNAISWIPLSLGVRSSWGVSGTELDEDDGVIGDGKSYTGIFEEHNWVSAGSLTRLITDMSGFIGQVVILRFRVVTNLDDTHYEDVTYFKGFYVDDVIIYGESLEESRTGSEVISGDHEKEKDTGGSKDALPNKGPPDPLSHTDPLDLDISGTDHVEGREIAGVPESGLWLIPTIAALLIAIIPITMRKRYP